MDEKWTANLKELRKMRKEVVSKVVSEEEYNKIIEKYKMDEIDPRFTERKHRIIVGEAAKLACYVIANEGTEDEVKTVILNAMVCMDAMKYKLDWARWKRDNGIAPLVRKYKKIDSGYTD